MRLLSILALITLLTASQGALAGPAVSTGTGNERISQGCVPAHFQVDPQSLQETLESDDDPEGSQPRTLHEMVTKRDCKPNDF